MVAKFGAVHQEQFQKRGNAWNNLKIEEKE